MISVGLLVVVVLTFAGVLWATSYHKNKSMMGLGLALITAVAVLLLGQAQLTRRTTASDIEAIEKLARANGYTFDSNNKLIVINDIRGSGLDDKDSNPDIVTVDSEGLVSGSAERVKTVDHELHFMAQMPALRSSSRKHSKRSSRSHRK